MSPSSMHCRCCISLQVLFLCIIYALLVHYRCSFYELSMHYGCSVLQPTPGVVTREQANNTNLQPRWKWNRLSAHQSRYKQEQRTVRRNPQAPWNCLSSRHQSAPATAWAPRRVRRTWVCESIINNTRQQPAHISRHCHFVIWTPRINDFFILYLLSSLSHSCFMSGIGIKIRDNLFSFPSSLFHVRKVMAWS
jgi:hypothetical protein